MENGFTQDLITRIKQALAFSKIEVPVKEVVKLEDVTLMDGTMLVVDKVEVGSNAMFNDAPAEGEFETADGSTIICVGGLVTEIKPKEADVQPEPMTDMTAILSRLEALEAKYLAGQTTLTAQMNATKKHLNTALEAIENVSSRSVAVSLEVEKPTKQKLSLESMSPLEAYRAVKQNMK